MIRDVNLENRKTHIYYWETDDRLYPSPDIFPNMDLFPSDVDEIDNIVSGSMKLDELIADSNIKFGEMYSSKFEVQVYNMPEDLSDKFIQVYQEDDGVYKSVFGGKIISCKQDNSGLDRTIVAYDMSYVYRDKDVSDWWLRFWENRGVSTIKICRESLLDYMKIDYVKTTLPNDSATIRKNVSVSHISFGTVLSMLCELNCCFPHFSRENILEFIQLSPNNYIDIENQYEGLNSSFEDYVTDPITGVEFYDSEGELKYIVGDITNTYKLSSNIFCYDMGTTQLNTVGTQILNKLKVISYTPANVKMIVGDLSLGLGTYIKTPKGNFYILENQYSSAQLTEQTIIARGEKTLGESSRRLTDEMLILNEKWSRLTFNVEQFKLEFGDYQKEVYSKFEQTSEKITLEVARGTKNLRATYHGSYIPTSDNYPANEWTTEDDRAKNVGATFYNTVEGRVYRWTASHNAIALTFDKESNISDYADMYIYCKINGVMRVKRKLLSGNEIAGKTFVIPNSEFYIALIKLGTPDTPTDSSYYGFSIASIKTGYEYNPTSEFNLSFDAQSQLDLTIGSAKSQSASHYKELTNTSTKPETPHNPFLNGTFVWKWTTGLGVSSSGSKYGWVPQEGFAYARIEQTADMIKSEVAERKFSEEGIRTDYISRITQTSNAITTEVTQRKQGEAVLSSRITQTATKIDAKVSKGSVSSELSLEPDQVVLKSGRLIVESNNFTLDKDGNVTMEDAKLRGDITIGLNGYGGKLTLYGLNKQKYAEISDQGLFIYGNGSKVFGINQAGTLDLQNGNIYTTNTNHMYLGASSGIHLISNNVYLGTNGLDNLYIAGYRGYSGDLVIDGTTYTCINGIICKI